MWRGKKYRQKFVDRVTDVRRKDPRALECWNRSERIYYFLLFISFSFVWMCILFKFRMCIQCWGRDTYTRNSNKLTSYTKAKGHLFPSSHWNCGFLTSGVFFSPADTETISKIETHVIPCRMEGREKKTHRERERGKTREICGGISANSKDFFCVYFLFVVRMDAFFQFGSSLVFLAALGFFLVLLVGASIVYVYSMRPQWNTHFTQAFRV